MEIIKNLIARLRHAGAPLVVALILIAYIAFGFLYWQQGGQQRELDEQIAKISLILSRPLASVEKLQAEYDNVTGELTPMSDSDAIKTLVSIAKQSGIDISEASGKLSVPQASFSQVTVGGGSYQLMSFRNVYVQGDPDNVMAFLADLDSGKTLKTMVLTRLSIDEVEVPFAGEEGVRRAEFRQVAAAVLAMMADNWLLKIPAPMSFAGGVASNRTGDDPGTRETVEGFPDITTTAAEKGYSGNATPRNGFVLYKHDRISTDNTTQFKTVSYGGIDTPSTKYYYTAEADGTVRQFKGADVATTKEYRGSEASKIELAVTVDVNIYMKTGK